MCDCKVSIQQVEECAKEFSDAVKKMEKDKSGDYIFVSCAFCKSQKEYPEIRKCPQCQKIICIKCDKFNTNDESNRLNLINVHTFDCNAKCLAENCCNVIGQGLCNTYFVRLCGTGSNKYVLKLEKDGKQYEFLTEDNFITDWVIGMKPEESDKVMLSFDLNAWGLLNGEYHWARRDNNGDVDILLINKHQYTVLDIKVNQEDKSLKPRTDITNEYAYIEKIMEPRDKFIDDFKKLNHLDEYKIETYSSDDDESSCDSNK